MEFLLNRTEEGLLQRVWGLLEDPMPPKSLMSMASETLRRLQAQPGKVNLFLDQLVRANPRIGQVAAADIAQIRKDLSGGQTTPVPKPTGTIPPAKAKAIMTLVTEVMPSGRQIETFMDRFLDIPAGTTFPGSAATVATSFLRWLHENPAQVLPLREALLMYYPRLRSKIEQAFA